MQAMFLVRSVWRTAYDIQKSFVSDLIKQFLVSQIILLVRELHVHRVVCRYDCKFNRPELRYFGNQKNCFEIFAIHHQGTGLKQQRKCSHVKLIATINP